MTRRLLLLVILVAPLYVWQLDRPGFSDTEGMFAEPAREMAVSGDWVTPRMNGAPFLTKPPLMYWLPAAIFTLTGPTEYARVWSVLAALATVAATGALGQELFGEMAGIAAATVLASTAGFFVEARMLRTDMVLVLAVTLTLYWYVRLRRGAGAATAAAFWATLGVGILDKGLVPLILAGATIAGFEIMVGELRPRTVGARLRALSAPWGLLLLVGIVLPWHVLAGAKNPGFLWDYVVNQHFLFFFDKKLPRDSIPDSLGFFWASFFVRGLPWSLLLPGAVVQTWVRARGGRHNEAAYLLPTVWLAVVLGFFSLAVSRLEHYCLPALPAMALLLGALLADTVARRTWIGGAVCAILPAVGAGLAFVVTLDDPARLLATIDPTLAGYGLEALVRPATLTLAIGLLGLALLLVSQYNRTAFAVGVMTAVTLLPLIQIAHERVEPLFSWRPFAGLIREAAPDVNHVFFHAEDEYQLCGGLNYYLERRLDLLAPPDWVAPTFLADRTDWLFTPRAEFEQEWRTNMAVLVSDAVTKPGDEAQLVPTAYVLVARAGERVLLRSVASGHQRSRASTKILLASGQYPTNEGASTVRMTSETEWCKTDIRDPDSLNPYSSMPPYRRLGEKIQTILPRICRACSNQEDREP
jgi:4-amino-4-deoxy-L-arabinose transferase-like glycosyltransferase